MSSSVSQWLKVMTLEKGNTHYGPYKHMRRRRAPVDELEYFLNRTVELSQRMLAHPTLKKLAKTN